VVEGLSRAIEHAKLRGDFKGILISPNLKIIHLPFVDDTLIFYSGSLRHEMKLNGILSLFNNDIGILQINDGKSTLSIQNLDEVELAHYQSFFPYEVIEFDLGIKYLGFHFNPNNYTKFDWSWILEKLEK